MAPSSFLTIVHRRTTFSPHSTATADGHIMAQILSTFGSHEQLRFEAFKRSTFDANAVETWVAACLQDRYNDSGNDRPLEDMVAPGHAQDVGLVVAIAAKIYAQRLVSEAMTLFQHDNITTSSTTVTSRTAASSAVSLPPTAVWKAVQARQRRGLDPGFFLQPALLVASSEPLNWMARSVVCFDVRRLAAEQAQLEYDKLDLDKEVNINHTATSAMENGGVQ